MLLSPKCAHYESGFCAHVAGAREVVPEGLQRGSLVRRRSGLVAVQRVRSVPRGPAATAHPHHQDKAGAPGLGPSPTPLYTPVSV